MSRVVVGVTPHYGDWESQSQGEGTPGSTITQAREGCERPNAETVLAIIHERGRRGLPLKRLSRALDNPDLYLRAYGRLYRNAGAMPPGPTTETVDGMARAQIPASIEALRHERYRGTPVRRVYIETKGAAQTRPLGLPSGSDNLLQEVLRSLLEADYEPQFSPHSHGFRPGRGGHTALETISRAGRGTAWCSAGAIAQGCDRREHSILLAILAEQRQDQRFLRLIKGLLHAGDLEAWCDHTTLSGVPHGGGGSPTRANIYLSRLDKWSATAVLPTSHRGPRRRPNPEYLRRHRRITSREQTGQREQAQTRRRPRQCLPARDPNDPGYRRWRYIRYADDWLLGFCGPRRAAEDSKPQLGAFWRATLTLDLSETQTLITHARPRAARFRGDEIVGLDHDHKHEHHGHRSINGQSGLQVARAVVRATCRPALHHGRPIRRTERIVATDYRILAQFQAASRGVVEYDHLAFTRHRFGPLQRVMERSLTKTLARKLRISVPRGYRRYRAVLQTDRGPRRGLQGRGEGENGRAPLVAPWGGISLARRTTVVALTDNPPSIWRSRRPALVPRLLTEPGELCGAQQGIEVHHSRHLKDLQRTGPVERPAWVKRMAARRRQTLVVCRRCHEDLHAGRPPRPRTGA